jgi:hypothetical protein
MSTVSPFSAFSPFCSGCGAALPADLADPELLGGTVCPACAERNEFLAAELGRLDPSLNADPAGTPLAATLAGALRAHVPAAAFAEAGLSVEQLANLLAGAACGTLSARLGFVSPESDLFRPAAAARRFA